MTAAAGGEEGVPPGRHRAELATGPVLGIAGTSAAVLLVAANRYGYHRDELYFLAAGRHLAWGYPDQPPMVPALARLISAVNAGSLVLLRTPSALAMGALVILSALLTREFGGGRLAQGLTAAAMATSAVTLAAGHLLSTTTFSLLAWTAIVLLVVQILSDGDERRWVAVGVVAGLGLLTNTLIAFLLGAVFVGILLAGPRRLLRSPWLWLGALIALGCWLPYLAWQAAHGWPQLEVSRSIAAGGSGTSEPRSLFLPFQLVLTNLYLAPVWITGALRLLRDPALRWCRALGWAYPLLAVVFIVTGGKPYYLAGMYPLLFAAGAQPAIDWMRRGRADRRRTALVAAVVLGLPAALIALPVVPVGTVHHTPIVDLNYDAGETIGWPAYVDQIAAVYHRLSAPGSAPVAVLASNYGEAGAVDRFGASRGLPHAYSGDMGYWYWGPPPDTAAAVLAIGFDQTTLRQAFEDVRPAGHLDNGVEVANDEQGAPLWWCTGRQRPWQDLWPQFRNP